MGRTDKALERAEKASLVPRMLEKPPTAFHDSGTGETPASQMAKEFSEIAARLQTIHDAKSKLSFVVAPLAFEAEITTMVLRLASTISLNSQLRILVVDAHLRKPSLGRHGVEEKKGMTDLLAGKEVPLFTLTEPENIFYLPCGITTLPGGTVFHSSDFSQALGDLQQQFDMVIFIGPPVIGHVDAKYIAQKTDGIVLVLESGKTRGPVAQRALVELQETGASVLGTILSGRKYHIPKFLYEMIG